MRGTRSSSSFRRDRVISLSLSSVAPSIDWCCFDKICCNNTQTAAYRARHVAQPCNKRLSAIKLSQHTLAALCSRLVGYSRSPLSLLQSLPQTQALITPQIFRPRAEMRFLK